MSRIWPTHAAAAAAGAIAGALIMLAASGLSLEGGPRPGRDGPSGPRNLGAPENEALVAWSPRGLPPGAGEAARGVPGVRRVTKVQAGLDWIRKSEGPDGVVASVGRPGFLVPWEVAVVRPRPYARFVPPAERDAVLSLRRGEALLAETSANLRGPVSRIHLKDRTLRVAGVVSDDATNGYEALVRGPAPRSWAKVDEFLLVSGTRPDRARLSQRLSDLLDDGAGLVVRARGENPFLRYGDAVLPQLLIKDAFGEFTARPRPDGYIDIDPEWRAANIRTARVPLLGPVTCHRALFPQLRGALRAVLSDGLDHLIEPADFGGCFSPRFINTDPDGRLSHHSWGIAFDVNVSDNAFAMEPSLDPRIVEQVAAWGFTWGGRWLIPDGMHFEWTSFP